MPITLQSLSGKIGAALVGAQSNSELSGIAPLSTAGPSQVSFLSNPRYAKEALLTKAGAVILEKEIPDLPCPQLLVKNAYLAWAATCNLFAPDRSNVLPRAVHSTAVIHPGAKLGRDVHVGPHASVGARTVIGDGSTLHAGVVIEEDCRLGKNVEVHPNAVIHYGTLIGDGCVIWSNAVLGAYGFGYAQDGPKFVRIAQLGRVVLEDNVDIGAGTTVDRGAAGDTLLRRGTKVDNLVQIAHNVEVGEDSAIAAQSGLSGSLKIGNRVKIAGQVGFVGHITIGDDSFIGAKAGVSKSYPEKSNITGYPARPFMEVRRSDVALTHLPELLKRVAALEAKLNPPESKA
jgi:UDP-3-O-[3-hydroxymyristoyl] glucosamine N-acyltransferase